MHKSGANLQDRLRARPGCARARLADGIQGPEERLPPPSMLGSVCEIVCVIFFWGKPPYGKPPFFGKSSRCRQPYLRIGHALYKFLCWATALPCPRATAWFSPYTGRVYRRRRISPLGEISLPNARYCGPTRSTPSVLEGSALFTVHTTSWRRPTEVLQLLPVTAWPAIRSDVQGSHVLGGHILSAPGLLATFFKGLLIQRVLPLSASSCVFSFILSILW